MLPFPGQDLLPSPKELIPSWNEPSGVIPSAAHDRDPNSPGLALPGPLHPHPHLERTLTHRQQVSQGHREAYGQGGGAPKVTAPPVSGGQHTEHQLQGADYLDTQALA